MLETPNLIAILAIVLGLAGSQAVGGRAQSGRSIALTDMALSLGIGAGIWFSLMVASDPMNGFAVAGHASRMLFVVLPAALLGPVVIGRHRSHTVPALIVAASGMAVALIGIYAVHIEPLWLRVDELQMVVQADGTDHVRVAVLADLQTDGVGAHERRAVASVMAAQPDIIIIPGDLFQGDDVRFGSTRDDLKTLLRQLRAPLGVYFVEGDNDRHDRMNWLLRETEIVRLDDEIVQVAVGDQTVHIGGNRIDWESNAAQRMRAELASLPADDMVILAVHRPDAVLDLPKTGQIDLVIAGHTHGGQVVFPFLGPPVTSTDVPREVARGGLHRGFGTQIYVSTGVGVERTPAPRLRFLNRPSVGILVLQPSSPSKAD